jgi:hypothetical protein
MRYYASRRGFVEVVFIQRPLAGFPIRYSTSASQNLASTEMITYIRNRLLDKTVCPRQVLPF